MAQVGRPLKFKTPEDMQAVIDAYFAKCDPHVEDFQYLEWNKEHQEQEIKTVKRITEQVPYTMAGLADALDLSRQALMEYDDRDGFGDTIKKARRKVEIYVEQLMLKSNGVVAGVIFNAKNNFGWRDRSETDITTNGKDLPTPILGGASNTKASDDPGD